MESYPLNLNKKERNVRSESRKRPVIFVQAHGIDMLIISGIILLEIGAAEI